MNVSRAAVDGVVGLEQGVDLLKKRSLPWISEHVTHSSSVPTKGSKVVDSPSINVLLPEVGLKVAENVGVGGPTQHFCNLALAPVSGCSTVDLVGSGL